MTVHDRIEINAKIKLGKPVIKDSCITVELILREIAEGADEQAHLEAYPHLTVHGIHSAVRYTRRTRSRTKKSCSRWLVTEESAAWLGHKRLQLLIG